MFVNLLGNSHNLSQQAIFLLRETAFVVVLLLFFGDPDAVSMRRAGAIQRMGSDEEMHAADKPASKRPAAPVPAPAQPEGGAADFKQADVAVLARGFNGGDAFKTGCQRGGPFGAHADAVEVAARTLGKDGAVGRGVVLVAKVEFGIEPPAGEGAGVGETQVGTPLVTTGPTGMVGVVMTEPANEAERAFAEGAAQVAAQAEKVAVEIGGGGVASYFAIKAAAGQAGADLHDACQTDTFGFIQALAGIFEPADAEGILVGDLADVARAGGVDGPGGDAEKFILPVIGGVRDGAGGMAAADVGQQLQPAAAGEIAAGLQGGFGQQGAPAVCLVAGGEGQGEGSAGQGEVEAAARGGAIEVGFAAGTQGEAAAGLPAGRAWAVPELALPILQLGAHARGHVGADEQVVDECLRGAGVAHGGKGAGIVGLGAGMVGGEQERAFEQGGGGFGLAKLDQQGATVSEVAGVVVAGGFAAGEPCRQRRHFGRCRQGFAVVAGAGVKGGGGRCGVEARRVSCHGA